MSFWSQTADWVTVAFLVFFAILGIFVLIRSWIDRDRTGRVRWMRWRMGVFLERDKDDEPH